MNKKKITPALLSGMMTISMGTTPISVLAQEEQPQEVNKTNVEQVNEPVSTEETEITVNTNNDSQNTSTEQQNKVEESNDNSNTITTTSIETEKEIIQENSVDPLADIVASVTIDETTSQYSDLTDAFNAANGKTATITILQNCSLEGITITGGNITVKGNDKTINGVEIMGGIDIDGGTLNVYNFNYNQSYHGIQVTEGILNFFSGKCDLISSYGPEINNNGIVNIYSGEIGGVASILGGSINYIPNSITIDESTVSIPTGSEYQLNWEVNQNTIIVGGNNITISPAWSSDFEDVATVSTDGTITAVGVGTAIITASAGGQTDTCTVTVKNVQDAPDISKLSVATTSDSLGFGYLGSSSNANIDKLQYTYAKGDDVSLPCEAQWDDVEVIGDYTGVFDIENLEEGTPYTIFLRYKETDDCFSSDVVSKAFYTFYKQPKPSIDYINEQLANLVANKEYKITLNASSEIATSDENGKIDIKEEWMGKDLKISVTGKPISEMSGNILIPARPATPSLFGEVTGSGVNDCKITGLKDNIAYEIYSDKEQIWKEATVVNGEITGLSVGTYQVRIKASSSSFASEQATVTINKADSSIKFKQGFSLDKTYDTKAVSVNADNVETTGSKRNVSFSYEKKVGDTWETLSEAPTGAGTYRVTAILEEDTNYNSATSQPLEFTIGKAQIKVGFNQSNIDKEYDGKEVFVGTYQQGGSHAATKTWYQKLDDGTWKELTNTPKNAGSYKVVLKAEGNENYIGAQTEMTFEITKAVPSYTLPSGLIIKQGDTLSSVVLPEGFTWKDGTQKADTLGTQTFKVTYTPSDTTNYQTVDFDITVDVVPATTPVNQPPVINAKDQTLTVGDKFDPMKGVTATDKEDGDLTDKIVITKNTVDTSKAGKYTINYEVTDNGGTRVRKTIVVTVKEKATTSDEENKPDTDKKTLSKDTAQTSTQTNVLAWTLLGLASAGAFITGLFKRKHQ